MSPSPMSLWRMLLTAVSLVGLRFGGAALGLVSQILLARLLPQEDVGIVLMGMSAAAIISLIITAGYPSLTMTVLPRYYALGRASLATAFQRALWHDTLWVTAVFYGLGALALAFVPMDMNLKLALTFGALMAPASALIRITSSTANSRRRFQLSYVPDFLFRPGLLLAFLLLLLAINRQPDLTLVTIAVVAITFVVAIGQALILGSSNFPDQLTPGRHDLARHLRRRAGAMMLIAAVAMSFADLVTLIGGLFLASHDVARLGIAIRLAALAGFVTQVTQNFLLPDLSAALVAGNRKAVGSLIGRSNIVTMGAIALCVAGAVVAGPLVLGVFGAEYRDAHWPLVLFMVSQLFRAAGGMNQHLLSLNGFQTRSLWACLSAMIVLAGGAAVLTPMFGLMGMAAAVLMAEACWAMMLGVQAQRHAGVRGDVFAALSFRNSPAE